MVVWYWSIPHGFFLKCVQRSQNTEWHFIAEHIGMDNTHLPFFQKEVDNGQYDLPLFQKEVRNGQYVPPFIKKWPFSTFSQR